MALPVEDILPALRSALARNVPVALVAPPGAGKTTAIAPALLDEDWAANGRILLLSPRRLAARAAAERMAEMAGEPVGRTIGYRTRMDSKVSAATRIEVVTEGIFTRMLVADPELPGIAAVLFDEIHERSLDSDLALALTLDVRAALRPDLRLLLMSATLDGAAYEAIVPGLERLESAGRMFPVELRHIGRSTAERLEDAMAAAIRRALAEEQGSILAFLPGVAEIERTAERLAGRLPPDIELHLLHGARDAADQRAAIRPPPAGVRKVVLATAIAETSITIDGVRIVVDSGLARRPRLDRSVGLTRLVTERASQAAVTQRAGRAGRTAPGIAIRLWEAAETAGRPRFDPPEILESDLADLVLDCARWGVTDPATLRWLDPPPAAAVADARARLLALGALDADGRPTPAWRGAGGACRWRRRSAICCSPPLPRAAACSLRALPCCSASADSAAAAPTSKSGCASWHANAGRAPKPPAASPNAGRKAPARRAMPTLPTPARCWHWPSPIASRGGAAPPVRRS